MSLNLASKKDIVAEVEGKLGSAQTVVIAQYKGVVVSSMTKARFAARKSQVYLRVLKNTLAQRAVSSTKFEPLAKQMQGQLIYSISDDPIAAAKVIHDFTKENNAVKIVGGMYNDRLLDANMVKDLATIPSRNELLAMLLGVMLQVPAKFVRCVAAIRDKKQEATGTEQ